MRHRCPHSSLQSVSTYTDPKTISALTKTNTYTLCRTGEAAGARRRRKQIFRLPIWNQQIDTFEKNSPYVCNEKAAVVHVYLGYVLEPGVVEVAAHLQTSEPLGSKVMDRFVRWGWGFRVDADLCMRL